MVNGKLTVTWFIFLKWNGNKNISSFIWKETNKKASFLQSLIVDVDGNALYLKLELSIQHVTHKITKFELSSPHTKKCGY